MSTAFVDSFGHYDTAGIALKYSSAGGSINTNLAHVRTGVQSLTIQAGDAPSILNFQVPSDLVPAFSFALQFSIFNVGMAYQAEALSGDVYSLRVNLGIAPAPEETILTLTLNSDGSLSLLDGTGAEIGRSAAGAITVGAFYYLSLTVDLLSSPNTAVLNVTNSGFVSADVLTVSNFTVSQTYVDAFYFGGPVAPHHGYVNDFQFVDTSDGTVPAFAPNIVWGVANRDGTPLSFWDFIDFGSWQPQLPVGAPHTPLVDSVPEDTSQGITFLASPQYAPTPGHFISAVGETFFFDVSALPANRTVESVQTVFLFEYGAMAISGVRPSIVASFQDDTGTLSSTTLIHQADPNFPFTFLHGNADLDPFTGLAWQSNDWIGGLRQAGPTTGNPG